MGNLRQLYLSILYTRTVVVSCSEWWRRSRDDDAFYWTRAYHRRFVRFNWNSINRFTWAVCSMRSSSSFLLQIYGVAPATAAVRTCDIVWQRQCRNNLVHWLRAHKTSNLPNGWNRTRNISWFMETLKKCVCLWRCGRSTIRHTHIACVHNLWHIIFCPHVCRYAWNVSRHSQSDQTSIIPNWIFARLIDTPAPPTPSRQIHNNFFYSKSRICEIFSD